MDKEINLSGDGTEKPEFEKWAWMSPEQVIEHAVDFKKPVYEQVLNVFSPYLVVDKDEGSSSSSSTVDAPPVGYRRNVGICLINSSRKIFTASRLYIPGSWQMPQGGADEGENPRNAAIRELREETGVTSAEIIAEVPYWLTYDFPPQVKAKINRRWGSDWKGQAQKWFLFKFTGKDKEINLLGDGSEKPEFGKWSWMSPEQVFEHAVHFKKPVYEQVLNVFSPYLVADKNRGGRSRQSGNQ